jgi:hypothetical protein
MIDMKYYKIDEETLKGLLYDHYVLSCLYEAGVDNWLYYMDNRTDFINQVLDKQNPDEYDENLDFSDIVDKAIIKYEEIK